MPLRRRGPLRILCCFAVAFLEVHAFHVGSPVLRPSLQSRLASRLRAEIAPMPSQAPSTLAPGELVEAEGDPLDRLLKFYDGVPTGPEWPPSRFMEVRGVRVHYKDTDPSGKGKRGVPTFVLMHGFAGSTASFDEIIPALAQRGRVVAFDRPGFGLTERVLPPTVGMAALPWAACLQTLGEDPYSADFASKLTWGLLDRLAVDDAVLVAHSLGAQVALRAARARPEATRALILAAPAVLGPLDGGAFAESYGGAQSLLQPLLRPKQYWDMGVQFAKVNFAIRGAVDKATATVREFTLRADLEDRVRRNFYDPDIVKRRPELVAKYLTPLKEPNWDTGLMFFYRAMQGEIAPGIALMESTAKAWRGHTLVIAGADDPTVPLATSRAVARGLSGRLMVLQECSHIPMDERSDDFVRMALSFVDSASVRDRLPRRGAVLPPE